MSRRLIRWLVSIPLVLFLLLPVIACTSLEAFWFIMALFFQIYLDGVQPPTPDPGKAAVVHRLDGAYLGAAAHVSGAADTDWRSDVELHNAANEGATVTLELLAHGADSTVATAADLIALLGGLGDVSPVTIEDFVGYLQDEGPGVFASAAAAALPGAGVSSTGDTVTVDFDAGTVVDDVTLAGSIELDLSGLVIDGNGVSGEIVESYHDYTADGRAALFDEVAVDADLTVDAAGRVMGTVGLTGGSAAKVGNATLSGLVGIDTGICLHYPVSGSISFTTPEGEVITIRFGPDCDGSFTTEVEPAWDWEYRHQNPLTDWAHSHIVEVVNAHITSDVADYWKPDTGGTTFYGRGNPGDTPPGVITYRFDFANPVAAAHLDTDAATFNFETSRGHTYLLASRDGVDWVVVNDVPPPVNAGDPPNSGHYIGPVPASVLGGHELWIRLELYAYGTGAVGGFTSTAQHARHWDAQPRDTFILQVACAGGSCSE